MADDPINETDLDGLCIPGTCWIKHTAQAVSKAVWRGVQWVRHRNDHSTKVSVTVYFTDYGLQRLKDRNISQEQVINTIENAQGKYSGFNYVHNEADRVGFWHQEMFVATELDGQGDLLFINAFRNVSRRYVDRIIKLGHVP